VTEKWRKLHSKKSQQFCVCVHAHMHVPVLCLATRSIGERETLHKRILHILHSANKKVLTHTHTHTHTHLFRFIYSVSLIFNWQTHQCCRYI